MYTYIYEYIFTMLGIILLFTDYHIKNECSHVDSQLALNIQKYYIRIFIQDLKLPALPTLKLKINNRTKSTQIEEF